MKYTFIDEAAMSGWLPGEDIPKLIKDIKNPIGIELGTAEGFSTEYLLSTISDLTLYGIDPYVSFMDCSGVYVDYDNNGQYEKFIEMTNKFNGRYKHYRTTSDDAVSFFLDGSLDFIFIDGLHSYDQVLKDCINYYPKIKKGGLFSGHDWSIGDVLKAVTDFTKKINYTEPVLQANQDIWYWYKNE